MRCGPERTLEILDELLTLGFTDAEFHVLNHLETPLEKHTQYCQERTKFQKNSPNEQLSMKLQAELARRKK